MASVSNMIQHKEPITAEPLSGWSLKLLQDAGIVRSAASRAGLTDEERVELELRVWKLTEGPKAGTLTGKPIEQVARYIQRIAWNMSKDRYRIQDRHKTRRGLKKVEVLSYDRLVDLNPDIGGIDGLDFLSETPDYSYLDVEAFFKWATSSGRLTEEECVALMDPPYMGHNPVKGYKTSTARTRHKRLRDRAIEVWNVFCSFQ